MELIAHERVLFDADRGNWLDLRVPYEAIFQVTWCHGAPGIGMARLRSLDFVDDSQIRAEIDAALETTVADGFGGNHSLCHGDLGTWISCCWPVPGSMIRAGPPNRGVWRG